MYHDIRPGVKSDRDWLWSLYCSSMREHVERAWGWDEKFQLESFDKYLPAEEFQLIYKNNIPIGAYLLKDNHDHFWLEMLLIDPEYQNQGIGSKVLINIVSTKCTSQKPLKFSVIKSNPAYRLYKKLGFILYDEDESFYKMTSTYNEIKRDNVD